MAVTDSGMGWELGAQGMQRGAMAVSHGRRSCRKVRGAPGCAGRAHPDVHRLLSHIGTQHVGCDAGGTHLHHEPRDDAVEPAGRQSERICGQGVEGRCDVS